MGYAIAETLANRGAEVTVISGPVNISTYHKNIKVEKVISAQQMFEVTQKYFANSDIAICSAAVADYSPSTTSSKKLKKQDTSLNIELKPTVDILESLGKLKTPKQLLVGFALETENELENAKGKLKRKNCDILVLNSLNDAGAGFNTDTNKITLLDKDNKVQVFPLKLKSEVAIDICNKIVEQLKLL
jgi:phosphopantothenoylcysteine decarboxylase/phosphopantothenate--cysteine ligase